jgi:hypothetical protein
MEMTRHQLVTSAPIKKEREEKENKKQEKSGLCTGALFSSDAFYFDHTKRTQPSFILYKYYNDT